MEIPQQYFLIDDDKTNNLICEFVIRKYDKKAQIKIFTKPDEAITAIKKVIIDNEENQPIVVFLDVNMPTMTGWDFLESLADFKGNIEDHFSIYILSSSIETFEREADLFPMISGFLSKPLQVSSLEEIFKN